MRLGVLCFGVLAVLAAHAAYAQRRNKDDDTEATKRACSVADCFFERDVRDFEVIDQTHLIVYTGSQRCAFHVEVHGTLCDLTFAPELYFSKAIGVPDGRLIGDPLDPLDVGSRENLRICKNDLGIQVHGGRFTESPGNQSVDRYGNARAECRISAVTSITDDQLVEFYVGRGVLPPLPPMGPGEIEVGEQEEQETGGDNGADAKPDDAD
jgi:hypothetical protein